MEKRIYKTLQVTWQWEWRKKNKQNWNVTNGDKRKTSSLYQLHCGQATFALQLWIPLPTFHSSVCWSRGYSHSSLLATCLALSWWPWATFHIPHIPTQPQIAILTVHPDSEPFTLSALSPSHSVHSPLTDARDYGVHLTVFCHKQAGSLRAEASVH